MDLFKQFYRYLWPLIERWVVIGTQLRVQTQSLMDEVASDRCRELALHLGVSDYDLFVRANEWYHGYKTVTVDSDFKNYLLSGCDHIPYYVRQFTRNWLPSYLAA